MGQGSGGLARLPVAFVVEADVGLSLDAGVDVPGGFAMADGDDAGGFHGESLGDLARTNPMLCQGMPLNPQFETK